MALTQQIDRIDTIIATGDVSEKTFVGYDGKTCGADKKAVGVALYDASTGDAVSIAQEGRVIVTAGGAVAVGDPIASDANGKAITATTVDVGKVNGFARTAAAAADDLIELDIR